MNCGGNRWFYSSLKFSREKGLGCISLCYCNGRFRLILLRSCTEEQVRSTDGGNLGCGGSTACAKFLDQVCKACQGTRLVEGLRKDNGKTNRM